jgi:hypothetical protein
LRAIRSDDGHYAEGLRKRKGENGEDFKEFKESEEFKKEPGVRRSGVRPSVGTIVNRVERVVGRKSRRALDRFFPKILPRRI